MRGDRKRGGEAVWSGSGRPMDVYILHRMGWALRFKWGVDWWVCLEYMRGGRGETIYRGNAQWIAGCGGDGGRRRRGLRIGRG